MSIGSARPQSSEATCAMNRPYGPHASRSAETAHDEAPRTNATRETLYGRFLAQVEKDPSAPAVIDASGTITRAELAQRAAEVAAKLPARARRVGVAMSHGIPQIATILGILKTGAAYVPVEPDFPPERIRYMMENAQVDCVVTDEGILPGSGFAGQGSQFTDRAPQFAGQGSQPTGQRSQPAGRTPEFAGCMPPSNPQVERTHQQGLAYILYTSGTTGKPKGVMITNENVCNYIDAFAAEFRPTPRDTMLQYSVCSFDIFVEEVFSALLTGMTLAIPAPEQRDDITALMAFVERHNVTMISGFPYLLQKMNDLPRLPKSLRLLISGGDVLRARYVDRLLDAVDVYNTYGPSETTVCASYFRCNGARALRDGTYPVGSAVSGVQVSIRDRDLHEVSPGEVGEIVITGRGVGLGYVGDPPEQANFVALSTDEPTPAQSSVTSVQPSIKPKPTSENSVRAYRSGDLGYVLPDGQIAFLHRKDTQVMIDGRRVEPTEVESVLCTCPEVEAGVVRSEVDADQMPYLVGYYVPVDAANPARAAKLERRLREKMSRYLAPYMLPEYFVRLDRIPLTPNGKVDTRALPRVQRARRA